jgi:hypothetical protein
MIGAVQIASVAEGLAIAERAGNRSRGRRRRDRHRSGCEPAGVDAHRAGGFARRFAPEPLSAVKLESFPNGRYVDQVDACSGAFNLLTGTPECTMEWGWMD